MSTEAIRTYYGQFDEWSRLEEPSGQLEMLRCLTIINAHLPDSATILDLGAGPGRYAIEFARQGHRVTLVDLCKKHIETARAKLDKRGLLAQIDGLFERDACNLECFEDDQFDAVVAFGPFYHLTDDQERRSAAAEVARVLRPGGKAFVQFLPPMSGLTRLLQRACDTPAAITAETLECAGDKFVYHNPSNHGFQEAGYLEPETLAALFEDAGLTTLDLMSVHGFAAGREEALFEIQGRDPDLYDTFRTLLERTSRNPDVISLGKLALWIGVQGENIAP